MSNSSEFSDSELIYIQFAKQTAKDMNYFFSIIILPIGVILNLISVYVFLRRSLNTNTNMGFLCAVLCAFNVVALSSATIINALLFNEIKVEDNSLSACKFFGLWTRWILHLPSFQQVFMSIDIYISVTYPNRFKNFRSKKNYTKLIIVMVLLTFLINITYLFNNYDISSLDTSTYNNLTNLTDNTTTDTITCSGFEGVELLADIINVLMRCLIPFSIMLVLNILMSKNLFRSKRLIIRKGSMKKEYQFAISVVAMNFFFLVIYTPWSITFIIYQVYVFVPELSNAYLAEIFRFFQTIANCLAYINNFSVFFINFIFNVLYRNELLVLFRLKADNRVSSTGQTPSSQIGTEK